MTASTVVPLEPGKRPRVLQVLGNAIVGGMETWVGRFVPYLLRQGFEVSALCPFESAFTEQLRASGCPVYITPMHEDRLGWPSIRFAQSLVQELGTDVMHAHLCNAHALASLAGTATGVPTLATIHGRTVTVTDLEAWRLGNSQFTTVCRQTRQQILGLGVPASDVHLVPNGIDLEAFDASAGGFCLHRHLGLPPETELVGFVGRLSFEKNPGLFVRMAALVATARSATHFVLVGGGPMEVELRELARRLGLAGRLHFAGVQRDMRQVYAGLSLLALTSDSEAMPLALLEAMAAGLPVIATEVGGVPELVRHELTGFLVPAGDASALAGRVLALLEDPATHAAMGSAARSWVAAHASLARSSARVAELLVAAARRRSAGSGRPGAGVATGSGLAAGLRSRSADGGRTASRTTRRASPDPASP